MTNNSITPGNIAPPTTLRLKVLLGLALSSCVSLVACDLDEPELLDALEQNELELQDGSIERFPADMLEAEDLVEFELSEALYYGDTVDLAELMAAPGDVGCHGIMEGARAGTVECFDLDDEEMTPRSASNYCKFYEHSFWGGSWLKVYSGGQVSNLVDWGRNDTISSLSCTLETYGMLYEHINFQGWSFGLNDAHYIGDSWNDQVSSVKVVTVAAWSPFF